MVQGDAEGRSDDVWEEERKIDSQGFRVVLADPLTGNKNVMTN